MKEGDIEYFCICLLPSALSKDQGTDHVVATGKEGRCVYCRYYAVKRPVKKQDIKVAEKHKEHLDKLKKEYLEVFIKDRRYDEKVN